MRHDVQLECPTCATQHGLQGRPELIFLLGVGITQLLSNLGTEVRDGGIDFSAETANRPRTLIRHMPLQAVRAGDGSK